MVNRFTPGAQAVLSSAKKCAEKMGHSYIGSEHLILGMLSCECAAKKILEDKRIIYTDVYNKLVEIAGTGNRDNTYTKELTPKCKRIIESASTCSKRFNAKLIGTEHLLYSICEDGESVGGRILISMGVNLQILKNEIAAMLDISSQDKSYDKFGVSGSPILSSYGRNLNAVARAGKCDPLIGREKELERLTQVLCRRTKNNPCLIGEPGVGKTAIIEGLAQKINDGNVPRELLEKTIFSLDLSSMIAGAKYRGEFEERMRGVMSELKANPSIILFIDEIHTIIGAGAAEGAVDAANIIKPSLARAQLQIIGATTTEEYRRHIEKDAALERRFQPIAVNEPTEEQTVKIIEGLREKYESFHRVRIPLDAIHHAVKLSSRYINDRYLPDKAIDLIDEACSRVKMSDFSPIKEYERCLNEVIKEKELAILNEKFDLATRLKDKEKSIKLQLERANKKLALDNGEWAEISNADIEEIVTQWTSVPISTIEKNEQERLAGLEKLLKEKIVGQNDAVRAVAASIKRGRAGLKSPKTPIGSFLFLGPTGVGKTELAKALAQTVFGSSHALIRLDMSEYMEKHSVSKLIGSPPGYVGYEEGGILTKQVKQKPYSLILFDEIEKAHPDIYNILLQILDEGALTDSSGRQINFKNTIIILTSNIGAKSIIKPSHLGFSERESESTENELMKAQINDALKLEFPPEFLNRLDEIVTFNKLSIEDTSEIAELMLSEVADLSSEIGIKLLFDKNVALHIAKESYNKHYGARPLRRAITGLIENPLSEKILTKEIKKGDDVSVFCENGEIKFKVLNIV
ncbi:MAG: ATP-dependent Clp protease ATP-binding subunit [Ruminococcaceae bacterium]|nr:ATP-dependent Clp protease ATP-binding subunit [Oscillospiraceae bacterium]